MEREELIKSQKCWTANIQIALFGLIDGYLKENNRTKTQSAEKPGVTKGYVSHVPNGDFDHKISKLVELSLACNLAPVINFVNLDGYIARDIKPAHRLFKTGTPKSPKTKMINPTELKKEKEHK